MAQSGENSKSSPEIIPFDTECILCGKPFIEAESTRIDKCPECVAIQEAAIKKDVDEWLARQQNASSGSN